VDTKELESQRRGFLKAIENIEPFNEMSDRLVDELFAKSVVLDFAPYATVYNQRDKATAIFILVKGAVTSADGVTSLANGVFGHVEVIEGFHRVKTMIAGRPGATLRKINADDLNAAIEKQTSVTATKAFRVLRETPVFSGMSERELLHLKDQLYSKTFEPGAVIIRKGDMNADEMYIIESGSAVVSDYSEETDLLQTVTGGLVATRAADKEIILKSRGYFGEEALLTAAEDLEDEPPPTRRASGSRRSTTARA
jgi:CRP-like cAMP-binding protein